jgi:peptidoglycan/LPS O-acetylase OafA/YrhL
MAIPGGSGDQPMTANATAGVGERVPWLDGVRGIAILLVIATHFTSLTGAAHVSEFQARLRGLTVGGWTGVDLFFVVSGMLITGILLDTKGSAGYWSKFYARRVLRIFPLYYTFLAAVVIAVPLLYPGEHDLILELRHAILWFALYLTNIWIALRNPTGVDLSGTGVVWSLAVEEQFYLVWPFVVLLLNRRDLARVCIAMVLIAPAIRIAMTVAGIAPMVIYTATPARCDTLAVGALVAIALRDDDMRARLANVSLTLIVITLPVLVAVGAASHGFDNHDSSVQILGFTPLALFMGAFVAQGFCCAALAGTLAAPSLRWLGRYSYAIYLFHLPIATWLALQLRLPARFAGAGIPEPLGDSLFWLIAGGTSLACAWASWHTFEKQFLKLKRHVRYGREPAVLVAAVPNTTLHAPLREAA